MESREAWTGEMLLITVDRVLWVRGKMMKNKANGPGKCLVSHMFRELPTITVYGSAHWFGREVSRGVHGSSSVEDWFSVRCFLEKPEAKLERGIWESSGHRVDVGAGAVVRGGGGRTGGTRAGGTEGVVRWGGERCEL